ncbi:MAG: hypothetical protein MZV65_37915 [Chromatiales bacterium]|nr:hypothetical protein [Chromatiales bacterium]
MEYGTDLPADPETDFGRARHGKRGYHGSHRRFTLYTHARPQLGLLRRAPCAISYCGRSGASGRPSCTSATAPTTRATRRRGHGQRAGDSLDRLDANADRLLTETEAANLRLLAEARINTRKPLAYLLNEAWSAAWLYVDER